MITGNRIYLLPAKLSDRKDVYNWCFHSETTKSHSGPPNFTEIPIASYETFCKDYYEEYFFTNSRVKDGRGFLIFNYKDEAVGFISYSSYHLKPSIAELDIWMSAEKHCGNGYGVDAICSLSTYLCASLQVHTLIIAPSSKNIRAVKSYEKAGFKKTDKPMHDFLLDEYISLYGDGDYGVEETMILVKQLR